MDCRREMETRYDRKISHKPARRRCRTERERILAKAWNCWLWFPTFTNAEIIVIFRHPSVVFVLLEVDGIIYSLGLRRFCRLFDANTVRPAELENCMLRSCGNGIDLRANWDLSSARLCTGQGRLNSVMQSKLRVSVKATMRYLVFQRALDSRFRSLTKND